MSTMSSPIPMPDDATIVRGLVDTNILILRHLIPTQELPRELAISAVTLAELSAGPHMIRGDDADARRERARRTLVLQRTEQEFEALPFDAEAARIYGQLSGAMLDRGRTPRRRIADLQIAATAVVHRLPLFSTNADDYAGLTSWLTLVPVTRPAAAS